MRSFPVRLACASLAVLAAATAVVPAAAAQSSGTLPDSLARRVEQIFAPYHNVDSPGCALGIYRDGEIAYAQGFGMANLEHGIPITRSTVFDIGSTSKQFTAMAIALLARDGTLSLDDDVRKWIPEMPAYTRPVTIRQMVHHTSGVRDYLALMALQGTNFDGVTTDSDALSVIARQRQTNFEPGSEHLYSNSGYFLLGEVVKRASGKTLRAFAEERIFAPLGMRSTHFHDDHTMIVPKRATGYAPRSGARSEGFRIDMSGFEQTGDGAVLTTVEDLLLWDRNFYEPTVGDSAVLAMMHLTGTLTNSTTLVYAMGLMVEEHRGLRTVRHGGSWAGYRADLLRFPDQRTSIACLCNVASADPNSLADRVAEVVLAGAYKTASPVASAPRGRAGSSTASPSAPEMAALAGAYRNPATEAVLRISVRDGKLIVEQGGGLELVALDRNRFRVGELPVELAFEPARPGTPRRFRRLAPGVPGQSYEAFRTPTLSPAKLAEYLGSYYSEELDVSYFVSVTGGTLTLRFRNGRAFELQPTVTDTFQTDEGATVRFTRDGAGRVTGGLINAGRVRGIELVRR
ncbi:MAG: serine hydrolase [Gemmatimonadota bacterium]|nr:serine hydrolase [Gemmatimonadota bacterium]